MANRPREDRRRRMRTEEGAAMAANAASEKAPATEKPAGKGSSARLYSAKALTAAQPRISELVPLRKRWMFACLVAILIPIALVEQLYMLRVSKLQSIVEHTSALHLFGAGTIANWVASTLLLLASLGSLIIFSIRRHRIDDYSGRYRIWLWTSAFCLFCSLDAATGIHRLFMIAMMQLTDRELLAGGTGWWLLTGAAMAGILGFFLLQDVWRSRGASVSLLLSVACYVGATLFYLRVYSIGSGERDMMAWSVMLLSAHAFLLYSMMIYLRFLNLEASGKIVPTAAARQRKANARPRNSRSLSQVPLKREKTKKSPTKTKKPKAKPATVKEVEEIVEPKATKLPLKSKRSVQRQKRSQRRAA